MGSKRVGYDWVTFTFSFKLEQTHTRRWMFLWRRNSVFHVKVEVWDCSSACLRPGLFPCYPLCVYYSCSWYHVFTSIILFIPHKTLRGNNSNHNVYKMSIIIEQLLCAGTLCGLSHLFLPILQVQKLRHWDCQQRAVVGMSPRQKWIKILGWWELHWKKKEAVCEETDIKHLLCQVRLLRTLWALSHQIFTLTHQVIVSALWPAPTFEETWPHEVSWLAAGTWLVCGWSRTWRQVCGLTPMFLCAPCQVLGWLGLLWLFVSQEEGWGTTFISLAGWWGRYHPYKANINSLIVHGTEQSNELFCTQK